MSEDIRKQLENLEKRKENTQQQIRETHSRLYQDGIFNFPGSPIFSGDFQMYESRRNFLLQQLYDIQAQIDELKSKN